MGGKKNVGVNSKAAAGRARKAEDAAKKAEIEKQKQDAIVAEEWKKGANIKKMNRDEEAANKADEAARKRREKQALLAAEENELGSGGKAKGVGGAAGKKKNSKKKKNNDLAFLEESLIKDAEKKAKQKKREELFNNNKTNTKKKEEIDPLLANTKKMIGSEQEDDVGRQANKARMESAQTSGIDAALQSMNVGGDGTQPKQSFKALYNEFEEKTLPQVKEDYPGLRLTQYKEKVWQLWKKSPENPNNQE